MSKDMTTGKPIKLILAFMVPVYLGGLFQYLYSIVDSMIVGRFLGVDALAAVGSTGAINFFVLGWVMGVTSGFGILLSQAFGANDIKAVKHYIAMSVFLCIILAVFMTVGLLCAKHQLLMWMNTPEEIFGDTSAYIGILYAGLPIAISYNMLSAIARAFGDSKTPLYFLIISSVLNVVLDILLVAVIPLGVSGAAYATVFSQFISVLLCAVYIWKKYEIVHFSKEDARIKGHSIWALLSMGIPMGLQFSITAIGVMIVQSSLNLLGSLHIAAYTATLKIQDMVVQVFPALGTAVATYTGQNYGASKMKRISDGVKSSMILVISYSLIVMVFAWFLFPSLVQIFVEDPSGKLQAISSQIFHICMWFYIPLGAIFVFRNVLQGLGNGIVPMLGGLFELLARALVIFLLFDHFRFIAICLAEPLAWVSALVPLIPYYYWYMGKLKRSLK